MQRVEVGSVPPFCGAGIDTALLTAWMLGLFAARATCPVTRKGLAVRLTEKATKNGRDDKPGNESDEVANVVHRVPRISAGVL